MNENVIEVTDLGKRYRLGGRDHAETLLEHVGQIATYPIRNFRNLVQRKNFTEGEEDDSILWALRDVNFTVKQGDVLGIVGHNGAGKSTLLKILSRITPPTTGEIRIQGRVSSLLEVGTGFHQDLTGRDNVFMNGAVLGLTRREIRDRFDEIVEFSGIRKHIDTPVKFYSSGMKVRLAFSVAAHLDPEILIIDEVLAVGDLAFQQKCLGKMDSVREQGRTILFVSHNMSAVEGLCGRCILMDGGRMAYDGTVSEAIGRYREGSLNMAEASGLAERTDRDGGGRIRFTDVRLNQNGGVYTGESVRLELDYEATVDIPSLQVAIKFSRSYREVVMTLDNRIQGKPLSARAGNNTLVVELPALDLIPDRYLIDLWAGAGSVAEDRIFNATSVVVLEKDIYGSGVLPQANRHGFLVPPACRWETART
ncbi:ABC transporter ATP-binding protein [Lewinella sp. IMCC34191]|uniref:ABC transporter ATP-binding protein n=1 Tax=Lewinella sp. IMCC34191 TaxID=2259172 RepID=UPI000E24612D|nr:ABC transporter ATP-binding protein [Lewinella sp. IMCC34191]